MTLKLSNIERRKKNWMVFFQFWSFVILIDEKLLKKSFQLEAQGNFQHVSRILSPEKSGLRWYFAAWSHFEFSLLNWVKTDYQA